jgi:hypothetical protein
LSVFVLVSWLDVFIVVGAGLTVLTALGLLPHLFAADGYVAVWGSRYSLDPPAFPWVAGSLGVLTLLAAWFAVNGRRFAFVLAVSLAWVGFGWAAVATGSGNGLLLERSFMAVLLITCRSWFTS